MKDPRLSTGFTVIEVMLFLAISGLMFVGLIVGIGSSINRERYNDTVQSLFDFTQSQYSLVDNVNSNRSADYGCYSAGFTANPTAAQPIGTSDCTIIGRLITSGNGSDLVSQPIYATADIKSLSDTLSEEDYINSLNLRIAPDGLTGDKQEYRVSWGTSVYVGDTPGSSGSFSLVLLRLPTNGLVRTYFVTHNTTNVASIINESRSGPSEPLRLCVNPDGLVSTSPMGVRILQIAANANGAQRITSDDGECS